ncbi:hypothetical protein N308_05081, partial [Struthio camelus australis]
KQCSFFFLSFNSTSEMTSFFHTIKKSDINPVQLKRCIYKTFLKRENSEELTYLNIP